MNAGGRAPGLRAWCLTTFFVTVWFFAGACFFAGVVFFVVFFGGVVTAARPARRIEVPAYGAASCGVPSCSYAPRTRRRVTVGAPVSTTRVPGAGLWVSTRFDE